MNSSEQLKDGYSYETCESLYQVLENFDKIELGNS
jgi:hypothetical protein